MRTWVSQSSVKEQKQYKMGHQGASWLVERREQGTHRAEKPEGGVRMKHRTLGWRAGRILVRAQEVIIP